MKCRLFLIAGVLLLKSSHGQNIVPNPNFSEKLSCVDDLGQVFRCKHWYQPTGGSSDYYNSCHDSLLGANHRVGVPVNALGNQASASNANVGFYTYMGGLNVREYVGTDIPPLTVGKKYRVTLSVSVAEKSTRGTNGLEVFFYNSLSLSPDSTGVVAVSPQINFSTAAIVTDTLNWVVISDTFTADSAYTHLMIGNFKTDAETETISIKPLMSTMSYHYLDSVSVEEYTEVSVMGTDAQKPTVSLYPIPVKDWATIEITGATIRNGTLTVHNGQGAVVRQINDIQVERFAIDRQELASGFYYYQLQAENGLSLRGKMVVE
jgi:hypothetical protein